MLCSGCNNEPGGVSGANEGHDVDDAKVSERGQHDSQHRDAAPDQCPASSTPHSTGDI